MAMDAGILSSIVLQHCNIFHIEFSLSKFVTSFTLYVMFLALNRSSALHRPGSKWVKKLVSNTETPGKDFLYLGCKTVTIIPMKVMLIILRVYSKKILSDKHAS